MAYAAKLSEASDPVVLAMYDTLEKACSLHENGDDRLAVGILTKAYMQFHPEPQAHRAPGQLAYLSMVLMREEIVVGSFRDFYSRDNGFCMPYAKERLMDSERAVANVCAVSSLSHAPGYDFLLDWAKAVSQQISELKEKAVDITDTGTLQAQSLYTGSIESLLR